MKGNSLVSVVSALSLLLTGLSTATPWQGPNGGGYNTMIAARQQQSSAASNTGSPSASNTVQSSASGSNSNSNSATITGSPSRTVSGSGSASQSGSGSVSKSGSFSITRSGLKNSTSTAIDPRLPPGGVSMITPAPIDGMTFVKVGDYVTFQWNYTSLSVPPSYIDVIATNTINSQAYTIAANQSWQSTQAVTWDTGSWTQTNSIPFVVATYTLMVYDAASNPTAVPSAGYLGAFSNLQFGMYTPQPYVALNQFRCATCSGAMSIHERQALGVLIGTCVVTVLSFTWFAAGFGAFT